MPWVKLTDDFYDDPKMKAAGPLGLAMWAVGLTWCARNLTDGFVPFGQVECLLALRGIEWEGVQVGPDTLVRTLIDVGLWSDAPGGYEVNNYLRYQPSRAKVLADRERERERKRGERAAESDARPDAVRVDSARSPNAPVPVPVPLATTRRPDVDGLCDLLVALVEGNGARKPTVTKSWRDEARRLLDRDGVSLAEAERVMRWATSDDFWKSNILSMPTFRAKYDQLKIKANGHAAPALRLSESGRPRE